MFVGDFGQGREPRTQTACEDDAFHELTVESRYGASKSLLVMGGRVAKRTIQVNRWRSRKRRLHEHDVSGCR
jgi:hypothetical protein